MDFSKLIAEGYTAIDILHSLFKKEPKQWNKIKKLVGYGYTAPTILRYLAGDKKGSDEQYMTSEERTFESDESRRQKTPKLISGVLGTIGGLGLLGKAGQVAGGAQEALESENILKGKKDAASFPTPEGFPSAQSQEQAELFEKFNKLPEQSETRTVKDVVGLGTSSLEKAYPQLSKFAEKMFSSGKTANEIYAMLRRSKLYNPLIKKYEEREKKSYLDVLEEFESQQQRQSLGNKEALKQSMAELLKLIGG